MFDWLVRDHSQFEEQLAIRIGDRTYTYGTLFQHVSSTAACCREHGILPGAVVTFHAHSPLEFLILLLTCIKNQYVAAPLSTPDKVLAELDPDATLSLEISTADKFSVQIGIHASVSREPAVAALFADGGFVRYTSGTTASAKGVFVSFDSAIERCTAANSYFSMSSSDLVYFPLALPFHFITVILLTLQRGGCLLLPAASSLAAVPSELAPATILYGSPLHFETLLQSPHVQLPDLRLAVSTSTKLPTRIASNFAERFGVQLHQVYGVIEIGLPLASNSLTAPLAVGRPIRGYSVTAVTADGSPLPRGSEGILAVSGPGMFDAYLSPFRTRQEVCIHGMFLCGDLVVIDEHDNVFLRGRVTSVLHVAGHKVFPEEIEDVLLDHPQIIDARVYGEQHTLFGEIVVAEIRSTETLDEAQILSFCRQRLPKPFTPQRIYFVDSIARTDSGKVLRHSLRYE